MFLFTSLIVGTAIAEKTTNEVGNDLEVELIVNTRNLGIPYGVHAKLINKGEEPIEGPVTVTFKIKKGLFGLRPIDVKNIEALSEGENLAPGDFHHLDIWTPDPMFKSGLYTFEYSSDYDDENPSNNVDSTRFLIVLRRMFRIY